MEPCEVDSTTEMRSCSPQMDLQSSLFEAIALEPKYQPALALPHSSKVNKLFSLNFNLINDRIRLSSVVYSQRIDYGTYNRMLFFPWRKGHKLAKNAGTLLVQLASIR